MFILPISQEEVKQASIAKNIKFIYSLDFIDITLEKKIKRNNNKTI